MVADAPPVDALLHEAAAADLIVLGTHGRGRAARWWLGSVAERVVRAATVPVLVTRAAGTDPHEVFKRLVLVQDEAGADASAVACAEQLAGLAQGSVMKTGPLAACDATVFERASLVVMPTPIDRTSWIFSDSVTGILGGCDRPVLFIRRLSAQDSVEGARS
jgi:hypothetical protein